MGKEGEKGKGEKKEGCRKKEERERGRKRQMVAKINLAKERKNKEKGKEANQEMEKRGAEGTRRQVKEIEETEMTSTITMIMVKVDLVKKVGLEIMKTLVMVTMTTKKIAPRIRRGRFWKLTGNV